MVQVSAADSVNVVIGGLGIGIESGDTDFLAMLQRQYREFVGPEGKSPVRLVVDLLEEKPFRDSDDDVQVTIESNRWKITRGDFEAEYDPVSRSGVVRQSLNRHSIDSVIRIIHTLALAGERGFLLHSASAIRNRHAFLFAGRSGAGKTTMSRCAPADVCLLSDEVSYIRKSGGEFLAWGTPFTGELGISGANRCAPVKALCFLRQAAENRLLRIDEPEALRLLLANVLFFAHDPELVRKVFESAAELVASVKAFRLNFTPDEAAWSLIQ